MRFLFKGGNVNLNKVMIAGNLTRDVELRYTPSGTAIGNFSIAINRRWTSGEGEKKEEATFLNCVSFGKQAEIIAQYFKKGSGMFIEGRIQNRSWEKDGVKRYATEIIVEEFQFTDNKEA
jgi:single-strand DNA-binding protein